MIGARFSAGVVVVFLASTGCGQERAGPAVRIDIAPLSLPGIDNACFDLRVATPAGPVWSQGDPLVTLLGADQTGGPNPTTAPDTATICSVGFGSGAGGDISYIGPCDATADSGGAPGVQNDVTIWVDGLYLGGGDVGDWQDPCPSGCTLAVDCNENADSLAAFDLTIMRRARQGFFDIAVDFEDVFCSAKLDCTYDDAGAEEIELLFRPGGARDTTAVAALACTTGAAAGDDTELHLSDVRVVCDGPATPAAGIIQTSPITCLDEDVFGQSDVVDQNFVTQDRRGVVWEVGDGAIDVYELETPDGRRAVPQMLLGDGRLVAEVLTFGADPFDPSVDINAWESSQLAIFEKLPGARWTLAELLMNPAGVTWMRLGDVDPSTGIILANGLSGDANAFVQSNVVFVPNVAPLGGYDVGHYLTWNGLPDSGFGLWDIYGGLVTGQGGGGETLIWDLRVSFDATLLADLVAGSFPPLGSNLSSIVDSDTVIAHESPDRAVIFARSGGVWARAPLQAAPLPANERIIFAGTVAGGWDDHLFAITRRPGVQGERATVLRRTASGDPFGVWERVAPLFAQGDINGLARDLSAAFGSFKNDADTPTTYSPFVVELGSSPDSAVPVILPSPAELPPLEWPNGRLLQPHANQTLGVGAFISGEIDPPPASGYSYTVPVWFFEDDPTGQVQVAHRFDFAPLDPQLIDAEPRIGLFGDPQNRTAPDCKWILGSGRIAQDYLSETRAIIFDPADGAPAGQLAQTIAGPSLPQLPVLLGVATRTSTVLPLDVPAGNAWTSDPDATDAVWQYATYYGDEAILCDGLPCHKRYFNVAIGYEPTADNCWVHLEATVAEPGAFTYQIPPGQVYPYVAYDVQLTDATGRVCTHAGLDQGSGVVTEYTSAIGALSVGVGRPGRGTAAPVVGFCYSYAGGSALPADYCDPDAIYDDP